MGALAAVFKGKLARAGGALSPPLSSELYPSTSGQLLVHRRDEYSFLPVYAYMRTCTEGTAVGEQDSRMPCTAGTMTSSAGALRSL